MRYASVVALKQELFVTADFTYRPRLATVGRPALVEGLLPNPVPTRPRLALGVAGTGTRTGFQLAIRTFDESPATKRAARLAWVSARGEANVQHVGNVRGPRPTEPDYQSKVRPVVPGYSVAHYNVTAGTIGAFVVLPDDFVYILSNNHVLADTNRGKKGDAILQPGKYDGGRARDSIGWLEQAKKMMSTGNLIDAAVAALQKGIDYDTHYNGRLLTGVSPGVSPGEAVWKLGRTTGLTRGVVTAVDVDAVEIDYSDEGDGSLFFSFDNQIEIKSRRGLFSEGGDSGSMIINEADEAVGLLFAGSDESRVTYANPIQAVLDQFGASLHP